MFLRQADAVTDIEASVGATWLRRAECLTLAQNMELKAGADVVVDTGAMEIEVSITSKQCRCAKLAGDVFSQWYYGRLLLGIVYPDVDAGVCVGAGVGAKERMRLLAALLGKASKSQSA